MNTSARVERRRWILSIAGTLIVGAGIVALFRSPGAPQQVHPAKPTGAGRVELTKVVRSEAALLDKTPLFLPTEWNTAHKEVVLPQSGGAFSDYAPKYAYGEAELRSLKPTAPVALSATDALTLTPPGPAFLGFGRSEVQTAILQKRGAYLEVLHAKGGRRALATALVEAEPPKAAVWGPLEFLATVDAAGLTGPLVLTAHSGVEDVDAYFQKYLTQNLAVGARLAPGLYRIRVGP